MIDSTRAAHAHLSNADARATTVPDPKRAPPALRVKTQMRAGCGPFHKDDVDTSPKGGFINNHGLRVARR